jgi:hypothetical protein
MTRSEAMTSPRRRAVVGARRGGEAVAGWPAFVWLARAGLLARGVSYGIIGILALELAVGSGGGATNQTGALKTKRTALRSGLPVWRAASRTPRSASPP